MLAALVDASREGGSIFWRQTDPLDIPLLKSLRASSRRSDRALARFLFRNGGRWDQIEENAPFIGREPIPPGRAFYPRGLTKAEIEAYVATHPEKKDAITSERTVVTREGRELKATPYHVAYRRFLEPAARDLKRAASLSDDPAFARFLRMRAEALLSDDYYDSDVAWVQLVNPKFDLILAPYENYLDGLLGVKASYGAAVLVRNEAESAKLTVFQKYVPDIQEALPLAAEDKPSQRGKSAPMEVMDTPFRSGDLRHGYQSVADNLPNDPRIHERVGSKRIFFKNYMDARVAEVILPLAHRVMREDQAAKATPEGYLAGVMMHEVSHGIGPAFARKGGEKVDIRAAIGPVFSALEEAKADVGGMFGLYWLVEHGALPKERVDEYTLSYVAGIFRSVRFGTAEAHGRAEMMEFNVYSEAGAIARDAASGRYAVDTAKMPAVIASLAKELLEIEATGDSARAEAWFKKYDAMPPDLRSTLDAAKDVPVDFEPVQPFAEQVE
ncbi:MAG TPA: Zn-dependent hydrolase, partial [Thermoanaerobaculia bacterium]|nr:Zn-dependent hydrolase [Thermoanaerobaculia bacterium]